MSAGCAANVGYFCPTSSAWLVDWLVKLPGDGYSQTADHQRPDWFRHVVRSWEKKSRSRGMNKYGMIAAPNWVLMATICCEKLPTTVNARRRTSPNRRFSSWLSGRSCFLGFRPKKPHFLTPPHPPWMIHLRFYHMSK